MTLSEVIQSGAKIIYRGKDNKYGPMFLHVDEAMLFTLDDLKATDWEEMRHPLTITRREFLDLIKKSRDEVGDNTDIPVLEVLTYMMFGV